MCDENLNKSGMAPRHPNVEDKTWTVYRNYKNYKAAGNANTHKRGKQG